MFYTRVGIILLLFVSVSFSSIWHDEKKDNFLAVYEDIDVSITNGSITLTCKYDNSEYLEITDKYDLYLNGKRVPLDEDQKKLVADYYDLLSSIIEYAKVIGLESVHIGVVGAKIGLKALAGVMKVLFTEYESEDLEDDLEGEEEKIEEMARDLEDKAEDLEHLATSLEEQHERLRREIPQIRGLDWF